MGIDFIGARAQLDEWERVATDPRPRVQTGWPDLDGRLYRSSFGPGTFCIMAGRLHTRKTAVAVNLLANFLQAGVPCGLLGLDEATNMYVAKLASVITGDSHEDLDRDLRMGSGMFQHGYEAAAAKLTLASGVRPTFDELDRWLGMADVHVGEPLRVVVMDYMSLLHREKFDGGESTRIPRLAENLAIWTRRHGLVTIVLHQVGRQDDSQGRYHGDKPLTPEQLMHGGEQAADIIFGTYRPALEPIGNGTLEQAVANGITEQEWQDKHHRVNDYRDDTMLQLIKNRPGTMLDHVGLRLRSVGASQKMEVVT